MKNPNGPSIEQVESMKEAEAESSSDIYCPFCDEGDFDLPGLKSHLSKGDCGMYNLTETLTRVL